MKQTPNPKTKLFAVTQRKTASGFEEITIKNNKISLTILPEVGCKLKSLIDLNSGREWLWNNLRLKESRWPYGSSYVEKADTGGWDECFPSVAACQYPLEPWLGTMIQDHGDLWSQAPSFRLIENQETLTITSQWFGTCLPFIFERAIELHYATSRLAFHYSIENTGTSPFSWIWSAHPLLAIEPGMSLIVPQNAEFNVYSAIPDKLFPPMKQLKYPMTLGEIDLTTFPQGPKAKFAFKIWSNPLTEGWARVKAHDSELRMRWDVKEIPQLGIWLNFGAWSGDGGSPHYNLALEPCIGAQDSLEFAVKQNLPYERLGPREKRTWSLEVNVG